MSNETTNTTPATLTMDEKLATMEAKISSVVDAVGTLANAMDEKNNTEDKNLSERARIELRMKKELEALEAEHDSIIEAQKKKYKEQKRAIKEKYNDALDEIYAKDADETVQSFEEAGEAVGKVVGKVTRPFASLIKGILNTSTNK